jgi:hypothetical protein
MMFTRRSGRRSFVVAGVVGSLLALSWPPVNGAAADDPMPVPAANATSALALAKQTGSPVEVTGLRTEYQTVTANPGQTLTLEQYLSPQRVRRPDGSWAAVDTNLRVIANGSVVPTAVPLDMRISGGGSGPLFSLTRNKATLSLSWPSALPAPALSGDTATYASVMPGIDLKVRATAAGLSHILVVSTPEAAANPALDELRFGLAATGLTVSTSDGVTQAVDSNADAVFVAPTPLMWDSQLVAGSSKGGPDGPGDSRQVAMPVSVAGTELVLSPDRAMLSDPATVWPVYIDPTWIGGARPGDVHMDWTQVYQTNANASYWRDPNAAGLKVGYAQDGPARNRSFFQFDTAGLEGKQILAAYFGVDERYAWTCTQLPVSLYVTGPISPATTWNNQPPWPSQAHGTVLTGHGYSSSCPAKRISWGVWAPVYNAANSPGTTLTFGLRTPDEYVHDPSNWHKYVATSANLVVEFNSYPIAPVDVRTDGKQACQSGVNRLRIRSTTPVLSGRLADLDGGTEPGEFAYQRWTGTAWGPAVTVGTAAQAGTLPGSVHQLALSLQPGDIVRWQMHGTNPLGAPYNSVTPGPWSPWCEFEVDNAPPGTPASITSIGGACPMFPLPAPTTCATGTPVSFAIAPPSGTTDLAGYIIGVGQSGSVTPITWVRAAPDGSATAQLAPAVTGLNEVLAKAVDTAGNISTDNAVYRFNARAGSPPANGPAASWSLERRPGDPIGELVDRSGHGLTLTTSGSYSLADNSRLWGAKVANFDGVSASATTAGPVIRTDQSFTVAAWVRMANKSKSMAILGQDGTHASGFAVGYEPGFDHLAFVMYTSDTDGTSYSVITSTSSPQVGVWTHVAAVYDAPAGQMRLYVNGVLVSSGSHTSTWSAAGGFAIGRFRYNSAPANYFPGDIADIRAWSRAVSATEAVALPGTVEVGRWAFDGGCCATAGDVTSFNRSAYLWAGASYTVSGHSGGALHLDGVTGVAATAGPTVRTDQSFTVSAWARPAANSNGWRGIVAANDTVNSAFFLRRDGNNKWNFTWVDAAQATYGGVSGTSTSVVGAWTHVAAVYDAQAKQARLYVNGVLEGTTAVPSIFAATGPLMIGGDLWVNYVNYWGPWNGDIDEVRVFQGAMTGAEIQLLSQNIYSGN